MSCLPCGKVLDKDLASIKYYKNVFKTTGKIFYAYRLNSNDSFNFVERESFNKLLDKIKQNFDKGAEYYHIQEFKGN